MRKRTARYGTAGLSLICLIGAKQRRGLRRLSDIRSRHDGTTSIARKSFTLVKVGPVVRQPYRSGARSRYSDPLASEGNFSAFKIEQLAAVGHLQSLHYIEQLQRGALRIEQSPGLDIALERAR